MFTAFVGGMPGDSETDTATAAGTDDEGNTVSDSDSATVNVNDVPSMITLIKTATPTSVDEPGGLVVYEFMVMNSSLVDTVTIDMLIDNILGDLTLLPPPTGGTQCSVPQVIAPSGAYTCQVEQLVLGDAADTAGVTNVATASGTDDDGNPVSDDDDANVGFNNVPPMATLTKTATMAVVTYVVEVTNDSAAEALTLNALVDDMFGNITQVQGNVLATTCAVPQNLAISGMPGDTYTCEFDGKVSTSPHTDEVTGDVDDNDGSATLQVSDTATVTFN